MPLKGRAKLHVFSNSERLGSSSHSIWGIRFSTVFDSFFSWQPIFNGFRLLFFVAADFQRFSAPFFRGSRFSTVFGSFFFVAANFQRFSAPFFRGDQFSTVFSPRQPLLPYPFRRRFLRLEGDFARVDFLLCLPADFTLAGEAAGRGVTAGASLAGDVLTGAGSG